MVMGKIITIGLRVQTTPLMGQGRLRPLRSNHTAGRVLIHLPGKIVIPDMATIYLGAGQRI